MTKGSGELTRALVKLIGADPELDASWNIMRGADSGHINVTDAIGRKYRVRVEEVDP